MCPKFSAEAKLQRPNNPSRTICDVRMLLGQRWSDTKLQDKIEGLRYRVVEGEGDKPVITVDIQGREQTFTPERITGMVMAKLRDTAAAKVGEAVGYAVVAVPAGFNDHQKQAVEDAGATVGLKVLRVIKEPVAALMAYGFTQNKEEENVIMLDLGASKTDITVANIDLGLIETLATVSQPIGGRIDNRRLVE